MLFTSIISESIGSFIKLTKSKINSYSYQRCLQFGIYNHQKNL
jgi:hypothetical protein